MGRNIVNWEQTLRAQWGALRFGDVKVQTQAAQHIFEAEVFILNDLPIRTPFKASKLACLPMRHGQLNGISGPRSDRR